VQRATPDNGLNAMLITQKKQYALRAVYELARQSDRGTLKTAEIATAQAIPLRFLEIILNRLKHAGLLLAKRGYHGGFQLRLTPDQITLNDIFQALEARNEKSACVSCISEGDCPLYDGCDFLPLWEKMQSAIDDICDHTTVQDLIDNEGKARRTL
jgi:Rrf2 family protein